MDYQDLAAQQERRGVVATDNAGLLSNAGELAGTRVIQLSPEKAAIEQDLAVGQKGG